MKEFIADNQRILAEKIALAKSTDKILIRELEQVVKLIESQMV